ncbi:hypothetical protein HZA99_01585 [Candidatus Woesearchaeota archaeon]|nr:hypothetical protein [Candidatus Woesearchaeota archaeon]
MTVNNTASIASIKPNFAIVKLITFSNIVSRIYRRTACSKNKEGKKK